MTRKYMTKESSRSATVFIALDHERTRHLTEIRRVLETDSIVNVTFRINALRSLADLLDRPRGRATWHNTDRYQGE